MSALHDYKDRFQWAMTRAGLDPHAVAQKVGVTYQAVKKVLAGTTKMLSASNNSAAAALFRVDANWLATGKGEPVDLSSWPLSDDLLRVLRTADPALLRRADNAARSVLGLEPVASPPDAPRKQANGT